MRAKTNNVFRYQFQSRMQDPVRRTIQDCKIRFEGPLKKPSIAHSKDRYFTSSESLFSCNQDEMIKQNIAHTIYYYILTPTEQLPDRFTLILLGK